MDRICGEVLKKLNAVCPTGRYAIIYGDELVSSFPEDAKRDGEELKRVIDELVSGGYIDVKYSRGDAYCIAPLKEYGEEPAHTAEVVATVKLKPVLLFAMLGGGLGSLIINLIFAVVSLAV